MICARTARAYVPFCPDSRWLRPSRNHGSARFRLPGELALFVEANAGGVELRRDAEAVPHVTSSYEPSKFRAADIVLGDQGTDLFEQFVDALVDGTGIAPRHRQAVAESASLRFAVGPVPEMLVAFEGASYEARWDGTVDDARRIIRDVLPSLAAQVKADRGRLGGHHPWDG
jgi:hypothetical protein